MVVTLHGGAGEVIQYTGKASGSVTLAANGTKTNVNLKAGTYTFTGKTSGYSKSVTIKSDTTVKVHPDGALFWYGNGYTSGDSLYSKLNGWTKTWWRHSGATWTGVTTGTLSLDGTSIYTSYGPSGNTRGHCFTAYGNNTVDLSNYSALKCKANRSGSGSKWSFLIATTNFSENYARNAYISVESSTPTVYSTDISGLSGNHYVMIETATAYSGANGYVYSYYDAIWLE